jgi:hypothetical protein
MLKKEVCLLAITKLRTQKGIETSDENMIATVHLMSSHGIDVNAALDQSSRNANDKGIDAWFYDRKDCRLYVYQSKLSESKQLTLRGLYDLDRAREWVEQVIINGSVEKVPVDNQCLYNLYMQLSDIRDSLKKISFILISLFDENELEDSSEYQDVLAKMVSSELNQHLSNNRNGAIELGFSAFRLDKRIPIGFRPYPISRFPDARINLRKNSYLDLAYVSLASLVALYRQRGDVLFDKNIRLSLLGTKEARERLVHPMESTLDLITSGKSSPEIFPFYHIGITLSATSSVDENANLLNLHAPSIINGCQTITIANEYLKRLETQKNETAIQQFKMIKVIAKVVVGVTDDELKEITNANNRQNPIENWQLFSNEPIHIEIEASLKELGVFYERQKGKFDTVMKNVDAAKPYTNTNRTFIGIVQLGQIIALAGRNIQWAAKPSDIFLNKETHDKIFDRTIPRYPYDMVLTANLQKGIRRGLNKYLDIPTYQNDIAQKIFRKPLLRAYLHYLALIYFYQSKNKQNIRDEYSSSLKKIASPILVDETQGFYQKVLNKTKTWYMDESKSLSVEVSNKKLNEFIKNAAMELGIDLVNGNLPFCEKTIDWSKFHGEN